MGKTKEQLLKEIEALKKAQDTAAAITKTAAQQKTTSRLAGIIKKPQS